MSNKTVRYEIPYPDLNDRANIPYDMEQMANKIDSIIGDIDDKPVATDYIKNVYVDVTDTTYTLVVVDKDDEETTYDLPYSELYEDIQSIIESTYTKTEMNNTLVNYALKSEIPIVSDFITKDVNNLTNYYTKTQIDTSLGNKADKNEIPDISNLATKDEIPDTTNFITKAVNDLTNYYLKSETYTKEEVNSKVSAIPKFSIEVVTNLPTSDISTTTIYLKTNGEAEPNLYDEFIYVNNKWEKLGTQSVDLTDYAKKSELPTKTSQLTNDSGFITSHQDITGKEDKSNKVTSISSTSTNTQYPSAKAVYDYITSLNGNEVAY